MSATSSHSFLKTPADDGLPLGSLGTHNEYFGAALIGLAFSAIVYGVTCLQVYLYYTEYSSRDRRFLKSMVGVLWLIESFQIALIVHAVYYYTVTNFGNNEVISHDPWSLFVQVAFEGLIFTSVETFFAYRIYQLSRMKNRRIPILIALLSFAGFASVLVFIVRALLRVAGSVANPGAGGLVWALVGLVIEVVVNGMVTIWTIFYLRKGRGQIPRTNKAINILISYCLNSGLLVTVFAIITLTLSILFSTTLIYVAFLWVLGRLYSCSFMSTLNSRDVVRAALQGDAPVISLSQLQFSSGSRSIQNGAHTHSGTTIQAGLPLNEGDIPHSGSNSWTLDSKP